MTALPRTFRLIVQVFHLSSPGTRAQGQWSLAVVSLRSAGGVGGMQMMSTWCSPSPEPVPWTAAPVKASPMAHSPASTLTELTSQMWTSVRTEYCSYLSHRHLERNINQIVLAVKSDWLIKGDHGNIKYEIWMRYSRGISNELTS